MTKGQKRRYYFIKHPCGAIGNCYRLAWSYNSVLDGWSNISRLSAIEHAVAEDCRRKYDVAFSGLADNVIFENGVMPDDYYMCLDRYDVRDHVCYGRRV